MILKAKMVFLIGILCVIGSTAFADPTLTTNPTEMALFEDIPVFTTSAGREQKLNDVANAMYVITKEDIERSGAREIADLFYRVPGMQIRQIDGNQYGVGIRENGAYLVNNLLVLVDGAVVFDSIFSGTIWENIPVSLDEIERIEIIRGSPGVLYSSNAVNGVINIITKSADTKDNYISQQGGSQSFRDSSVGVGGKIGGSGLALRAYLDNQFDQGFTKSVTGSYSDRYLSDRDGARIDYTPSDHQRLSIIANNNQQNSNTPNVFTTVDTKSPGQSVSAIINYTDHVTDRYDYSIHFDHVDQLASNFSVDDLKEHATDISTQHNFKYDLIGGHITSIGGNCVTMPRMCR